MTVITPKSVFLHIGRTGGHWVSHVLWRAGLVQARLEPLHQLPNILRMDPRTADRFWFCFVRHPLAWLRSVWLHEMEFGCTDPSLSPHLTGNFAGFLESLRDAHPNGPTTERIFPYLEGTHFVGRTERLADDLCSAMIQAGENFNTLYASQAPVNSTAVQALQELATAPRQLLESMLASDKEFAQRFGYSGVPEKMISDEAPRSFRAIDFTIIDQSRPKIASEIPLRSGGEIIFGSDQNARLQWALEKALALVDNPGTKLVCQIPGSDGAVGHLIQTFGFQGVDCVGTAKNENFDLLNRYIGKPVNFVQANFLREAPKQYEVVVAHNVFEHARSLPLVIARLSSLLLDGGELIAVTPILELESAPSIVFPFSPKNSPLGPECTTLYTRSGLFELLAGAGFCDLRLVDEFFVRPWKNRSKVIDDLCLQFGTDPDFTIKFITLVARVSRFDNVEPGYSTNDLNASWWGQQPLWSESPIDGHSGGPTGRFVAMLKSELQTAQARIAELEITLADREADLHRDRLELVDLRWQIAELHNRIVSQEGQT